MSTPPAFRWAGYWTRSVYEIDVTQEGVVADGVTSDRAALQALIDARYAQRKYILQLPERAIALDGPLVPKSDVMIRGVYGPGYGYSILRPLGDFPVLQSGPECTRFTLEDVMLQGNNLVGGQAYLLDLRRLWTSWFRRVFMSATVSPKTYRGLRMMDTDSITFDSCQITECRGRMFHLGARNSEARFINCNFESDSGFAAQPCVIDNDEWFGQTPLNNTGRGYTFVGGQWERAGALLINARDVLIQGAGHEQTHIVLGRKSRRCIIALSGNYPSTQVLDYGIGNEVRMEAQNIVLGGGHPPLDGELADGHVTSSKGSQRSVYGTPGTEFVLLHDLHSATITSTGQSVSLLAYPSGASPEVSDTHTLPQVHGASHTLDGKSNVAWLTTVAIPPGDSEIRSWPSAGSTMSVAAWRNLLQNGTWVGAVNEQTPAGWAKVGAFIPVFDNGWLQMTAAGAGIGLYQDLPLGAGHYMLAARVKGDVTLCLGAAWSGTDGYRSATAYPISGITDYYGPGDHLLQIFFKSEGNGTRVSFGRLGVPISLPQIKWVCVVRTDTQPRLVAPAAPSSPNRWFPVGAEVDNAFPAPGQPDGWRCVVAGKPGTWAPRGILS